MEKKTFVEQFLAARVVGSPIISITTPDQEVTVSKLTEAALKENSKTPIIRWDCVRGWKSKSPGGAAAIERVVNKLGVEPIATRNALRQLEMAEELPPDTILFLHNVHHRTHQMERPDFWQALWNLRDSFKGSFRTVVLMAPSITLPIDISSDVLSLKDPMPDETALREIVDEISGLTDFRYTKSNRESAAKALLGLPPFAAEQAVALALKPDRIEVNEIFERKRELLNDIPGLRVYSGTETFDSLGGCDEAKTLLKRVLEGNDPPEVIVFIDEGEKMMAGATHAVGDNTGVSQDFMGTLLSFMEDHESDGTIFVGPTGTAKSALAKAMGNEANIPTVFLDLGAMKNSLVGASEHRIRYALEIIEALSHGKAFFIMTSNNISKIPPEFKRRFSTGTLFFDLPTYEEQQAMWDIHTKAYGLDRAQVKKVDYPDWTGAEIRNCCRMAYRQKISLEEAAKYIVPVAVSGAESIHELRRAASGNFLSANYPGTYKYESKPEQAKVRKIGGVK